MSQLPRILIILFVVLLISCNKNEGHLYPVLSFSEDTVYFDTVFSSIGSATHELRVKNNTGRSINIDKIALAGGDKSAFRLNIDGEPATLKNNIELEPYDSIFCFVDVNVDPAGKDSPVAITDSILFSISGSLQKVQLLAWGQDIVLLKDTIIKSSDWTAGRPYVIYGNILVDTSETLTIHDSTRVYFHRNGGMKVAGKLIASGSMTRPIEFAGDRTEAIYEDIPGQWNGLIFLNTSQGNVLNNLRIKGAITGVKIGEGFFSGTMPDMQISNTSVMHASVSCLVSVNATVNAWNCVFSHSGSSCINISSGGDYSFTHCSVFNSWDYGYRLAPAVLISENASVKAYSGNNLNFSFKNSVVYGDLNSEFVISAAGDLFTGSYVVDHCLLKLDTVKAKFWSPAFFSGNQVNRNPGFENTIVYDLRPDTLSPLIDKAYQGWSTPYPFDFRGHDRFADGKPDIGAFERLPGGLK